MQQAYVDINGVPTSVITWGKWIDDGFAEDEPKDIVLCIPGNPGVTKFYESFLQTIYEEVGLPVWIIGHAGHEKPSDCDLYDIPPTKGNENLYNLQGQIEHKVAFIEKYVPKDARIHFVGHSVGSYTILNLLKIPSIKSRVVKNYFLFPTIEYLRDSLNGIFMTKIIQPIVSIILFFSWVFSVLPSFLQVFLVSVYCKIERVKGYQVKPIISFIDPYVLENVFLMAYDQRDTVVERENEVLKENIDSIKLYYGANDNWAPVRFCKNLKKDIPGIDAEVCSQGFTHAFVLRYSEGMGRMVSSWLKGT